MEIPKRCDYPFGLNNQRMIETVGHDPKLESIGLLTIFPEEVWLEILKRLYHPEDFERFGDSSRLFKQLLQNIRTKILFPAVIKMFFSKYKLTGEQIQSVLLNCRLVCRTWELGVNSVLHSIFNYRSLMDSVQFAWKDVCGAPFTKFTTQLTWPISCSKFLECFDDNYAVQKRNPFMCRSVYINFRNTFTFFDIYGYISQLLKIFEKYGNEVLHFRVFLCIDPIELNDTQRVSNVWCYERLRDFLKLVPNLKVLTFCYSTWETEEEVKDLKLMMQSFEFPALKNLQHLRLEDVPTHVCAAFLRRYAHVPMLSIQRDFQNRDFKSSKALYTQHLPNLTGLSFHLESNKKLAMLETSNIATWPLKTLVVKIGTIEMNWEKLFGILQNRWEGTLTELWIDFDTFSFDRSMKLLPRLKLPNIKRFVFITKNFVPLDFILGMKNSLEFLVVKYSYATSQIPEYELENEKVIKFYRFYENIMNSNIWELFPKLEKVKYSDKEFEKVCYRRNLLH